MSVNQSSSASYHHNIIAVATYIAIYQISFSTFGSHLRMNIRFFIILFLTLVTLCSCEGSPKSEQISSFWNWYNTTVAADSSFSESVEMSQFDRVEIRDLPGKGLSVFAKVDISKGEPAIKIPSRMAMGMNDVHGKNVAGNMLSVLLYMVL